MGKINYGRVILGGIVGGIVGATLDWFLNGVLLGQLWIDTARALNHPDAFSTAPVAVLVGLFLLFVVGAVLMIWLYAAVRPRLGGGVRTAVYVGLVAWTFAKLLPNTFWVLAGIFGRRIMFYDTLAGIVEIVAGTVVGAALYKEAESTIADPATAAARQTTR
jgi:uncharacterized membrane protein